MKPVIRINGEPVEPEAASDIIEVEPGVYSVIVDGCSHEIAITGSEVRVDGIHMQLEREDPRRWSPASSAQKAAGWVAIKALMPGKVVRLLVEEGDEVAAGQGLLVVEAMKMQNEMKTPRAGRVSSIRVKKDEAVTAGSVLLTIE
jgi:acetyl/propionyl-CoA carboxylase alpha subunit